MLLYTRIAAPKQPKRRSRGGCAYCKEKKKKCDEKRPKCSRCVEHDTECAYEAVKPRQRRRRDSDAPGSPSRLSFASRRCSQPDFFVGEDGILSSLLGYSSDDPIILSPSDGSFEGFTLPPFCPRDFWDDHHPVQVVEEEEGDAPLAGEKDQPAAASTITTTSTAAVVPRARSRLPDLAMIAPCPVSSPLLDFCSPAFSEFSDRQNRRALVDHFCNVLSHLIVFCEETGNPFQQLVLPLTRAESPVTYAIFALACAHLEYRGVENAEKSLYFHNMAIRGVAQLIQEGGKAGRNEILAAIM
ncbi:fungal zn binuclear cluster domain-containing protein, partial [Staphylotrichum tortipilum]